MPSLYATISFLVIFGMAMKWNTEARDAPHPPRYSFNIYFINGCESGILMDLNGTCTTQTGATMSFHLFHLWEDWHTRLNINDSSHVTLDCVVKRGYSQRATIRAFDQAADRRDHRCGRTGECWHKLTEVGIYWSNENASWTKLVSW